MSSCLSSDQVISISERTSYLGAARTINQSIRPEDFHATMNLFEKEQDRDV